MVVVHVGIAYHARQDTYPYALLHIPRDQLLGISSCDIEDGYCEENRNTKHVSIQYALLIRRGTGERHHIIMYSVNSSITEYIFLRLGHAAKKNPLQQHG
ncbi:uncharacterized protein TrAFT101_009124 [Trichoderma asperellum]|uniref:uncharacterized protein n=1 Tax=Trichoderma asperellum TaxID=101201 RepID=UPI00332E20C6|nr:hypothetical protein TrAFT101_009124 [Trichoderma asperellum]